MLRLKDIHYDIPDKTLYKGVELLLGNKEKVALIGRNGTGKTTLFNIIMGNITPDEGEVILHQEKIGYLPQLIDLPDDKMVGEFIEELIPEQWEQYRAMVILEKLGYRNYDEFQEMSTLSGGQKMKLKLVEILLEEPSILLLDEPTNHLDLDGIIQFEKFIKRFKGVVIMISHDRSFLNNTVDQVLELEHGKIETYIGNFDDYKVGKTAWIERNIMEGRLLEKKKRQLEQLLENARGISDGKARGKAVRAAKKRIEREVTNVDYEKYVDRGINSLELTGEVHNKKLIIRSENLKKSFGENTVFDNLNVEVRGRERVWLKGDNGAGKSTFVKILMDELKQDSGEIEIGTNVRIGYFAQIHDKSINERRLMEYFQEKTGTPFESAFGPLQKFLFNKADFGKKIENMSPGERARLLFSIFTYNEYELLILDEPTNHLDIQTKELIEKALKEYKGAILLVSHDRYFVDEVGMDKVYEF